jgi:hypothetical protein
LQGPDLKSNRIYVGKSEHKSYSTVIKRQRAHQWRTTL